MTPLTISTAEEIRDLMSRGFKAGWVAELREGDIFADHKSLISSMLGDEPRKLCVVERFLKDNGNYHNVVSMIVTDEDGLERHITYGGSLDIYIWKGTM